MESSSLGSLWEQYGSKQRPAVEYALVADSSPVTPGPEECEDEETLMAEEMQSGAAALHAPYIISWRTNPRFEVRVNVDRLRSLVVPALLHLLPSFVRPTSRRAPRKMFPTSYLDGLRGVAALFVVVHHYALVYVSAWGSGGGRDPTYLMGGAR